MSVKYVCGHSVPNITFISIFVLVRSKTIKYYQRRADHVNLTVTAFSGKCSLHSCDGTATASNELGEAMFDDAGFQIHADNRSSLLCHSQGLRLS